MTHEIIISNATSLLRVSALSIMAIKAHGKTIVEGIPNDTVMQSQNFLIWKK